MDAQLEATKGERTMTKLILAATAAAMLIAAPAFAETRDAQDAPAQTVSAKGVNFSSRDQVKSFYAKLRVAAAQVCSSGSAVDAACVRDVTAQAVKAADKPVLTAMYNSSSDSNRAFAGNDQ